MVGRENVYHGRSIRDALGDSDDYTKKEIGN